MKPSLGKVGVALALMVLCGALATHLILDAHSFIEFSAGAVLGLLAFLALLLLLAPSNRARLTIGRDGVWLAQDWRRGRLIPWSRVGVVLPFDVFNVEVVLHGGERVRFSTGPERDSRDAALAQLRGAHASWCKLSGAVPETHLPMQNRQSTREWIAALRGAVQPDDPFRAATDPGALWRVIDDPRAPVLERAAAAVAVSGDPDSGTRDRLRDAAGSVAHPGLRALFECTADAGQDQLVKALDAVSGG